MSEVMKNYTPGEKIEDELSMLDRKNFLAGEYKFVPELIEVWVLIY